MRPDFDCDGLDMVGKIKRLSNQLNWFHPKTIRSQRESSKQFSVQILFWCYDTVCWAVGPCIASEPIRGESRGHARPNTLFIQQLPPH
jgi:hypothetical protein